MQLKFLIAFVLMGSCLIQATSAQPSDIIRLERSIVDNAVAEVKRIIAEVLALINQRIQEALKSLEALKDKVSQLMNQAIEAMKQNLRNIIQKAQEAIEKLIAKAEQAGIDISDCVAQNEGRFQELFEKFLADEVHCVTGEVDKVKKMIDDAVNTITHTADTIMNAPNELQNCLENPKPITCIFKLTTKLVEMKAELVKQIATTVSEVTEFVTGLQARLQTCATNQLVNAAAAATGVVADIAKCAAEKGLELIEHK